MAKPNPIHREHESTQRRLLNWQKPGVVESKSKIAPNALTREIEFALLPDGRMLDLTADQGQPSKLGFLVWQDGNARRASQIEHDGELLVPPKLDLGVVSAVRLPSQVRPCPEARELFSLIMDKIGTYVDVTSDGRFLEAALVLMTWFADRIAIVPYMWICGPPDSGKTTLMRVFHCLCRRAIHASAITAASIYRMGQIKPTLLIDDADFATDRTSRDLQRLLRGGTGRDHASSVTEGLSRTSVQR